MTSLNQRYERALGLDDPRFVKLHEAIEGGQQDAINVFDSLERLAPKDQIAPARAIEFDIKNDNIVVGINGTEYGLHRNAITQMVGRTGILTAGVADKMIAARSNENDDPMGEKWGQALLLHNLREIFGRFDPSKRFLIRSVAVNEMGYQQVRGFLSDSYRRMNVGPIFQAFAQAAVNEFGAKPLRVVDGYGKVFKSNYVHDLKMGFSLFLPHVFKPINGLDEFIVLGIMVQNSDFGAAALSVSLISLRIICCNLMITENELRKIHLGARLPEDFRFSQETYEKDTETMSLAVQDITRTLFGAERVNKYNARIEAAATQEVDADALFANLRSGGHLLKAEEKEVKTLFSSADFTMMPPGQNAWRAAQAISLFANKMEQEGHKERAVELREGAGVVLDKHVKVA